MPSVTCYCANYYGSINCHNAVTSFGDRCALCLANCIHTSRKEDLQNALSQGDQQWVENILREQLRREEEKTRRDRVRRSSSGGV
ncbi:hypothetical protein BUE80_DR005610, partial [Diplocarpon rosae]